MNTRAIYLLIGLSVIPGGCGSHRMLVEPRAALERTGLIKNAKQAQRLEKAMTDGQIAQLLDLDVKAKLPTTLAVAKLQSNCSGYQPVLDRIDAEELKAWAKIAARHPGLHGVQPISNLSFGQDLRAPRITLHSLRTAAARLHCELLFVYMQADSYVDNYNDAAALYWSLVGLWVVPGNRLEHKTVMQAIVVDCRTGMILGTATGDSRKETACPAMFVDIQKAKLARQAPAAALADLQGGCDKLMSSVISRAATGSDSARSTRRVP